MEDVTEKEVDELVDPEDDGGGEAGYVVQLGEGQEGGHGNCEHVPRYKIPLHGWISINLCFSQASVSLRTDHLHHVLLEGDGIPAVLPHHGHVPVGAQSLQMPLHLETVNSGQEDKGLCLIVKNSN